MNLFGKKKKQAAAPSTADTIIRLRTTIETLDKREEFITTKMNQQTNEAKLKLKKKDKKGAMFCLKRKKMYENEITKLAGAKLQLEQQIFALEGAHINTETFQASRAAAGALRAARGDIDADQVDEVLDDINEEMELANEIGEAISRPAQDLFDDDELLAELDELEELGVEEELLEAPAVPSQAAPSPVPAPAPAQEAKPAAYELPDAPTGAPQTAIQGDVDADDLEALRALEAELAV
mmetsp:Transcript_12941/g.16906  ORF Transcript_12941/g.16906 Transcript_12941/m.16906 type:complete len:238 (+) Transcript_12941:128-841(+)